jgi:hypothetical protein
MSRASRTAELLAALQLAPLEVEREQVRARQQNATSRAIASLVPALIEGGASIAGDVIGAQKADALQKKKDERDERDALARIADRKTTAAAQTARADAMKAKAEADKVKATADAAEATRKADEAAAKSAKEATVAGIEAGAGSAAAMLPTGGKRRVVGTFRPGESPLDEVERLQAESGSNLPLEQIGGMVDRQALEDRKSLADVKVAERKANAPTGPKPPNPMQALRDEKLRLEVEQLRGKPAAAEKASTDKKKQQVLEVDNFVGNIKRNIKLVKDQIAKTGTFELTGPEGAINERRLTEIATDMAKLADPGSVAREGEVMLMRKGLVDTGVVGGLTRDATAQAVLDALDADVDRRRQEAYLVRGLDMGAPARPATAADADAAELGFTIDED